MADTEINLAQLKEYKMCIRDSHRTDIIRTI